jgi:hypothetical protein
LRRLIVALFVVAATGAIAQAPSPVSARPALMTPSDMVATQQAAMQKVAALKGAWRGTGWMIDSVGDTMRQMVLTERVGPFQDGAVTVIETRGYMADGKLGFHAFNTISFDAQKAEYAMNARAAGRSGNFSFRPTAEGYVWQIGARQDGGGRLSLF